MSASAYQVDPEYQQVAVPFTAVPTPPPPDDLDKLLPINRAIVALALAIFPCPEAEHVIETTFEYTSSDGTALTLHRFAPTSTSHPPGTLQPAVLYLHGGAYIGGSVDIFRKDIIRYAHATGTTFFAPGYRLAPEYPYPKPLEDVYAALQYLHDHAPHMGVDRARLGVMGFSAGGGLAAAVALFARDQGLEPGIKKLFLVCPMLDDRTTLKRGNPLEGVMRWTGPMNEIAWEAYLAGLRWIGAEVPPYAAPARLQDFRGFPKTYIDAGQLDLFWAEARQFAINLWNVEDDLVESHWYPGVPHGWEWIAPNAAVSRQAVANRIRALEEL